MEIIQKISQRMGGGPPRLYATHYVIYNVLYESAHEPMGIKEGFEDIEAKKNPLFVKCFKCAENLCRPISLCSESIARVGINQKPGFPGLILV